jgi:hypothetical protein
MRGRAAGHGVLRSFSDDRVGAAHPRFRGDKRGRPSVPSHGRPRGGAPTHKPTIGVHLRSSAVSNPSSAGHGLHPSFSNATLSPRARRLLAGAAPLAGVSAGHGVHPSFSSPAIVPAGTP